MKKNVLFVGQFLGSLAGGAEKSTLEILENRLENGCQVTVWNAKKNIFLEDLRFNKLANQITVIKHDIRSFGRFPYLKYVYLKYKTAKIKLNFQDFDEIIIYDFWGRAMLSNYLMNASQTSVSHYIRCEMDLGVFDNYRYGFKRFLWWIYYFVQLPFLKYYKNDFKKILFNTKNFTNSYFLKNFIHQDFGVKVEVQYPQIDIKNIFILPREKRTKIGFIGDHDLKGLSIVRQLAIKNPKLKFKYVVRKVNSDRLTHLLHNEEVLEWVDDLSEIYSDCLVLLVPSQCKEAFGRVAREGYLLNLSVLCSNLGGLPEAVDYKAECLIDEYSSIDAWDYALNKKIKK
jgi:glycosyltransferase involved in cell wall biosynthesis